MLNVITCGLINIDNQQLLQQPLKSIASGFGHILIQSESGQIFSLGRNDCGQLGFESENPNETDVHKITIIPSSEFGIVKSIHCGSLHSIIFTYDNLMFSCGSNVFGQCGVPSLSENEHITRFTLAEIDDSVKSKIDTIICKFAHSGFVTSDRELYCCGRNHDSEIGIQNIDIVNKFSKVLNIPPVKLVDFAWKYTVIVTTDNEIFSSKCGILKTNSSLNPCIGKYEGWNSSNCEIIKLQCGNEHTVFLTSNMGLYGFGYSLHGEIGTSQNSIIKEIIRIDTYDRIVDEVTDFVTSYNQLIIFTSSGIIYVSGSNTKGQLNYFPSNDDNLLDCFKNPTKAYQSRFFNSACIANQFTILFHTTEGQSDTEKRFKVQMFTLVSHIYLTDLTILF